MPTSDPIEPAAIAPPDAAIYCGLASARVLAKLRQEGRGPAFVRLGHRTIVYAVADLDAWIESRRVQPIGSQAIHRRSATRSSGASTDGQSSRGRAS